MAQTDDATSVWSLLHGTAAGALSVSIWETIHIMSLGPVSIIVYTAVAGILMHLVHRHRSESNRE